MVQICRSEQLQNSTLRATRTEIPLTCIFAPFIPSHVSLGLRLYDRDLTDCCKGLHTVVDHIEVVAPHHRRCRPWLSALAMLPGLRAYPSPPSRGPWRSRTTSRRTRWPRSWTRLAGWAIARTSRHGV